MSRKALKCLGLALVGSLVLVVVAIATSPRRSELYDAEIETDGMWRP